MSGLCVRAPGKVLLFGEYAVLDGAPRAALVAAVERVARCRYQPGGTEVVLEALGLGPAPLPGDARLRFAEAARAACPEAPPGRYVLESDELFTPPEGGAALKLGLGSSAAVTVALVGAMLAARRGRLDAADRDQVFERALAAHRTASGGGSGADVAASTYGGVCRVTLGPGSDVARPARVEPLDCAPGSLALLFSGTSADTRAWVERVGRLRRDAARASDWAPHGEALDAARRLGEAALLAADPTALAEAVLAGRKAMEGVAAAVSAPELLGPGDAPQRADALAARLHARLKTTGAGGGDLYWLVPERLGVGPARETWPALAAEAGQRLLELKVAPSGVALERP